MNRSLLLLLASSCVACCSHDVNGAAFRDHHRDDPRVPVGRPEPAVAAAVTGPSQVRGVLQPVHRGDERQPDVELRRLLPGSQAVHDPGVVPPGGGLGPRALLPGHQAQHRGRARRSGGVHRH